MITNIQIGDLLKKKQEIESKITKAQGQRETLVAQLKKDFNITEEQISEEIIKREQKMKEQEEKVESIFKTLKDYIEKLEGIINAWIW